MRWKSKSIDLTQWIKVSGADRETPPMPEWFELPNLDGETVLRVKRSNVFRVGFADQSKYSGLAPVRQY